MINRQYKINNMIISIMMGILSSQIYSQTELLIRCDDVGMCHTVNMAVEKLIETGMPFSASVMFACPWYQESVEILKANPQISAGIHLVLNSEWKNYKWGPVAGINTVSSLLDSNGYFYESEADFANCGYKLYEVETELRAQIERALQSGLHIDYLDPHMNTAFSTKELRSIVEKLAKEYHLGISQYFNENYISLWDVAPEKKSNQLLDIIYNLKEDKVNLIVIHPGMETAEMEALIDLNNPSDPFRVSQHRQAELDALSSRIFEKTIQKENIKLITYKELISSVGLNAMRQPELNEY